MLHSETEQTGSCQGLGSGGSGKMLVEVIRQFWGPNVQYGDYRIKEVLNKYLLLYYCYYVIYYCYLLLLLLFIMLLLLLYY